MSHNLLL